MKTILFILLFSMVVLSQTNPDGYIGYPSIHLTPSTTYGSADYSEYGTMGNYNYKSKINYKIIGSRLFMKLSIGSSSINRSPFIIYTMCFLPPKTIVALFIKILFYFCSVGQKSVIFEYIEQGR